MTTVGILLAAGRSRRFGTENKLLASFNGAPLVSYAANALRTFDPDMLVAVTRSHRVVDFLPEFDCVKPPEVDPLLSDSMRAGVTHAVELGATRVLVVLGDMPFVTADLLKSVVDLCTTATPSATVNGNNRMPPACFPLSYVPQLLELQGDRGAAALLQALPQSALATATQEQVLDIDRPDQLA